MFESKKTIKEINFGLDNDESQREWYINYHKHLVKSFLDESCNGNFNIDNHNRKALSQLFYYFTGNVEMCQKLNISLEKGIYLCGAIGSGKTKIMQAFKRYTRDVIRCNSFQYRTSDEIIESAKINQAEYLKVYGIENPITCYIDDIASGIEKIKIFGTDINPIEEVLTTRYVVFQNTGKPTHVSCNLLPSGLIRQGIYGERTIDRMREMFNIILLNGNSRRK